MKFYEPEIVYTGMGECNPRMLEDCDGLWATRADAEQVEKDAVELARLVIDHSTSTSKMLKQAQVIIDRYEGGKP